jgi:ferritin-like metal-binding protein YciE
MSSPQNLKDLYLEELQDLWSANDQMAKVVRDMADAVSDETLKSKFRASVDGIETHTGVLKDLIGEAGGELKKEHCKGMEGLVTEARKHAVDIDADGDVKDVAAIAQFQRMSHYGIAGFGTARAFAEALGYDDAAGKLKNATGEIYGCDEYMTELAERSQNLEAKGKGA